MISILEELLRLGLVTENQAKRKQIQDERREKRCSRRNQRNQFGSVKEFLEDVERRLKDSPNVMKEIFRDAHWLADDLALNRRKRGRLHAFLCRVAEHIRGMDSRERAEFLSREIRKY